jgi:hypothetical protein
METPAPVNACGPAITKRRTGRPEARVDDLIRTFSERGDLAHLALFLWASTATALGLFALRELAAAMRRFDDFVRELSRFNRKFGGHDGDVARRPASDPR